MKIEIEQIENGWLVIINLGLIAGRKAYTFADSSEVVDFVTKQMEVEK